MKISNLPKKLCLVASPGGHFLELYLLKPFWEGKSRFWITFQSADTADLLKEEEVFWYTPVRRNPLEYLKALWWSLKVLRAQRPSLVVTTGASIGAVAVHAARLLGIKSVYIELTDGIDSLSLSGRLASPIATHHLVQWKEAEKLSAWTQYQGKVI